jgi:hypothetical protein
MYNIKTAYRIRLNALLDPVFNLLQHVIKM